MTLPQVTKPALEISEPTLPQTTATRYSQRVHRPHLYAAPPTPFPTGERERRGVRVSQ